MTHAIAHLASVETRHFRFEAHGITEEDARDVMRETLAEHGRALGLPDDWSEGLDVSVVAIVPGTGTRDGHAIVGPDARPAGQE